MTASAGAILVLALTASTPANAYQTSPNSAHLTYGVTGQRYWIDASAGNNESAITGGISLWNATSTPASYSRTTTKSASRLDFYNDGGAAAGAGSCADTRMFINTTNITPNAQGPTQNYWWARVYITPSMHNTALCGNSTKRKAIVAHEQGHVMGLAHANKANRLMYAGISGTSVNAPSSDDINGINHLY